MNRGRPFINRLVKQKQLELTDAYHDLNLKQMKPVTARLMEHSETVTINNSKREMIKEAREQEIQRQNRLLLDKISNVISKKGNYSVSRTKTISTRANKSLNQIARKKQLESIQLENKQLLHRLNSKRATLNTLKFKKDWEDSRSLIKRIQNTQFNLVYFKYKQAGSKEKKNEKILQRLQRLNMSQFRVINGHKMLIKIVFSEGNLNIIGDFCNQKDLKLIKIPKLEASNLIQHSCQGKLQKLLEKLSYDQATQTLYIRHEEPEQSNANPEKISTKINYKLKTLTHRFNKSNFERTPSTNKSQVTDFLHHPQISPQMASIPVKKQAFSESVKAEEQQKYQQQQFEELCMQDKKLTEQNLTAMMHNQNREVAVNKQAELPSNKFFTNAEQQQEYNQDFQEDELNRNNNIQTI